MTTIDEVRTLQTALYALQAERDAGLTILLGGLAEGDSGHGDLVEVSRRVADRANGLGDVASRATVNELQQELSRRHMRIKELSEDIAAAFTILRKASGQIPGDLPDLCQHLVDICNAAHRRAYDLKIESDDLREVLRQIRAVLGGP